MTNKKLKQEASHSFVCGAFFFAFFQKYRCTGISKMVKNNSFICKRKQKQKGKINGKKRIREVIGLTVQ